MRKIVAELFTSLDGVVGSPDQWHGPYHSEEMEHDIQAGLAAAGTMLLGRRTYQEHAGFGHRKRHARPEPAAGRPAG